MTLELNVHLSGQKASDLPWMFEGNTSQDAYFIDEGIELRFKGGIRQASLESAQSDMFSFIINSIDISASALTIGDFLYQKIKNSKNAKTRVGSHEIRYDINPDELRKIIREELQKLKGESCNNIFEDPRWRPLQEKFDAFLISFNEKWEAYKNAKEPEKDWLYNESKDAWESLENTKKEMFEIRKEYGLL